MAYEIPKELKYEEKILFGLSLSQLFWVGLFTGIAAIIFFKTAMLFELKVGLSLVLISLGVSFAFFNLFEKLKAIVSFKLSGTKVGYFDEKAKHFVGVSRVERDAIILDDGKACAVLQIMPISFSMLSAMEQKAVISAFRDFLNALSFPIQIVVRTVNLSLNEYLADLELEVEKRKSKKLREQFQAFKRFVQDFIEENAVRNRLFYIVVPCDTKAFKDKEAALNQLDIRAELCMRKLKRCNLLSKRLNSEELISLLASFFNGFIESANNYLFPLTMLERFEEEQKVEANYRDALGRTISVTLGGASIEE